MTALAAARGKTLAEFDALNFGAYNGGGTEVYYENAVVGIDTADGLLKVGQAALLTWVPVGRVRSEVTVTVDGTPVLVNLFRPIKAMWMANSAGDAVGAADILKRCFIEDDQTVSKTGNSGADATAGTVWAVDATKGVLVEFLDGNAALVADLEARIVALESA